MKLMNICNDKSSKARKPVRLILYEKDSPTIATFEDGKWNHKPRNVGHLQNLSMSLVWLSAMGPLPYDCKVSANSLNEQQRRYFLRASGMEQSLTNILVSASGGSE